SFRKLQQMRKAGFRRQVDYAARLKGVRRRRAEPAGRARLKLLLRLRKPPVGVAQEQQAEDRPRILRRLQPRIRPQLVRDAPKPPLNVAVARSHPALRRIQSRVVDSPGQRKSRSE